MPIRSWRMPRRTSISPRARPASIRAPASARRRPISRATFARQGAGCDVGRTSSYPRRSVLPGTATRPIDRSARHRSGAGGRACHARPPLARSVALARELRRVVLVGDAVARLPALAVLGVLHLHRDRKRERQRWRIDEDADALDLHLGLAVGQTLLELGLLQAVGREELVAVLEARRLRDPARLPVAEAPTGAARLETGCGLAEPS